MSVLNFNRIHWRAWGKALTMLATSVSLFYAQACWAITNPCPGMGSDANQTLGTVALNVTNSLAPVGEFLAVLAFVLGIGFVVMGFLKLKQHKEAPTQHPVSNGIAIICFGIGLLFLPNVIKIGGATLFGSQTSVPLKCPGTGNGGPTG